MYGGGIIGFSVLGLFLKGLAQSGTSPGLLGGTSQDHSEVTLPNDVYIHIYIYVHIYIYLLHRLVYCTTMLPGVGGPPTHLPPWGVQVACYNPYIPNKPWGKKAMALEIPSIWLFGHLGPLGINRHEMPRLIQESSCVHLEQDLLALTCETERCGSLGVLGSRDYT